MIPNTIRITRGGAAAEVRGINLRKAPCPTPPRRLEVLVPLWNQKYLRFIYCADHFTDIKVASIFDRILRFVVVCFFRLFGTSSVLFEFGRFCENVYRAGARARFVRIRHFVFPYMFDIWSIFSVSNF